MMKPPTTTRSKTLPHVFRMACCATLILHLLPSRLRAQAAPSTTAPYTWDQIRLMFESMNPTLKANQANVDESRAEEITANLRPNPEVSVSTDGTQITPINGVWKPFLGTDVVPGISYLHERDHKRELRLESQKETTAVTQSQTIDSERGLVFTLRSAFVQVLLSKAILANAEQNLEYWDRELDVNRTRLDAGDVAQVDYNRLVLQRVQFESDYQTALVNLRTNKIQLLTLLNDNRIPVDQFDVTGPFNFSENLMPLDDFRNTALATRPDLKAAMESVQLAETNHKLAIANGSTDPTLSAWYTHNGSFNNPEALNTVGVSVSIPLRVFDKNQGEKMRTQIDIGRNRQLQAATQAGIFSEVDSAYWTLIQNVNLLKSYRSTYLQLSTTVRDTITFSFQNGGASLLDFLDAQKQYRDTQLAYINLIGAYLAAAAQMNMAVGQEVQQ